MTSINSGNSRIKLIIFGVTSTAFVAVLAAIAFGTLGLDQRANIPQAEGQNNDIRTLFDTVSPIQPQVSTVAGKPDRINGIVLTEVASTTVSTKYIAVENELQRIENNTQAKLSILGEPGRSADTHLIAFAITNTGSKSFYLSELMIEGQTKGFLVPLNAEAVSEGNHDKPNVAVRDAILINPGESYTGYIAGNFKVAETNEPITEFTAGVVYRYESADGQVDVWGAAVSYSLP
jgi:hypothetical protein